MSARIAIVNERDEIVGAEDQSKAVEEGMIHRIVRIFVFSPEGELYLQQRSGKVAWPGLWDQSVGGHVDEGEEYDHAARREAEEELGLEKLELEEIATYYSEHDHASGKTLRRFNRLYRTETAAEPKPNPDEIADGKWISLPDLKDWMERSPDEFTYGFKEAFQKYEELHG